VKLQSLGQVLFKSMKIPHIVYALMQCTNLVSSLFLTTNIGMLNSNTDEADDLASTDGGLGADVGAGLGADAEACPWCRCR
jgi:hypothetical protein